jgi:carboxyl-terminal processing protease
VYQELQLFSGVLNHIRVNYMDSVRYSELMRAAIDGMLHSLDPHSYYMSRRDWERQDKLERGDLPSVGAVLDQEDSAVTVLTVIPGSPAAKAGVQPGDRVTAVNDTAVSRMKAADVALRLAGTEGSQVQLRLERGSRLEPDTLSVILTRKTFKYPVVLANMLPDHMTGFIRMSWFGPKAGDEVQDAVRGLQSRGAQRLIFDLRDNPGSAGSPKTATRSAAGRTLPPSISRRSSSPGIR